jgi:hypothetical protein
MKRKTIYLALCVLGVALPYWQFVPWVAANGLNLSLFFHQASANRVSGMFVMDVLVSAVVLLIFVRSERARLGPVERWLPLVAVLTVGVSLGLPLFLYMRERNLEQATDQPRMAA